MRQRAAALAAFISPFLWSASAAAWCQLTTSRSTPTAEAPCVMDGEPLRWTRRCLSYAVDARAGETIDLPTFREVVGRSFESWLNVPCDGTVTDFSIREEDPATCGRAEFREGDGNINAISFLARWPGRYEDTAYALTTVWHSRSTGEIFDADIEINEELGPYRVCDRRGCDENPATGLRDIDLENVITHELGHFFGLAHSQFRGSTMDAVSPRGETAKRILRTDDVQGFCAVYPPGSLPGACDFTPRGGLDLICEDDRGGCSAAGGGSAGALLAMLLLSLYLGASRRGSEA